MTELVYLARSRTTTVWGLLIAATLLSWWMGVHDLSDLSGPFDSAGALIIIIAFVKVRFVAMHFMELRDAPTPLRALIDTYCLLVGGLLVGLLLI